MLSSETQTDGDGRFELPEAPGTPVRFLRVSLPGAKTAYLQVELSARARPLVVRLERRYR